MPEMEPYQVKIQVFEGPLDLLLHLVRKNKIDIMDIPIALITEQYLEYIQLMKALDINVAGEYLLMAATLMYIKSRTLLPRHEAEEEEDPRAELSRRLLLYEAFKEAASALGERPLLERDVFIREVLDEGGEGEIEADLPSLLQALRTLSQKAGGREEIQRITPDTITVRQKMGEILKLLEEVDLLALQSFASGKEELIVSFLALLELAKEGLIHLWQTEDFGPLWASKSLGEEGISYG